MLANPTKPIHWRRSKRGVFRSVVELQEQDIEAIEELPDRLISAYPNDVTDEGMKQLESMFEAAREVHAPALRGQDRAALAIASR